MIDKREILDMATKMSLSPNVVEKDYVLGWLLAGISNHPALRDKWAFKGGTCLKKCFFETYRFSEDLDFTITDPSHLDNNFLKPVFKEIGEWIYEQTGIQIPEERQEFEIYTNPRGKVSCQGKVSYRGPVSPRDMPRIKLDLTSDEIIVLPPVRVAVYHPYTDAPPEGIDVMSYSYEEVFGEKIRALGERTRPRDLYDVVNLFRNEEARPAPSILLDILKQKCDFKQIQVPRLEELELHRQHLMATWQDMLKHQLPTLPPYDSFWDELPNFFDWLHGKKVFASPIAYSLNDGDTIIRGRNIVLNVSSRAQSIIEIIRFGAANRLLVELKYQGSKRLIEPYSLRMTKDGYYILHAVKSGTKEARSYRVDRMEGASVTNKPFVPVYEIELTPKGTIFAKPSVVSLLGNEFKGNITSRKYEPIILSASYNSKPVYIYECAYCSKKFRRERMDSRLNPHKDKSGYNCSGRTGFLVDTKY